MMREEVNNWLKEIPKGHSLIYLAKRIGLPVALLSGIKDLNPEYLTIRDPDMAMGIPAELYDEPISRRHLDVAKEILEWSKEQMKR